MFMFCECLYVCVIFPVFYYFTTTFNRLKINPYKKIVCLGLCVKTNNSNPYKATYNTLVSNDYIVLLISHEIYDYVLRLIGLLSVI